jgi:hypothetical protein
MLSLVEASIGFFSRIAILAQLEHYLLRHIAILLLLIGYTNKEKSAKDFKL